jgi:hypothetical protein
MQFSMEPGIPRSLPLITEYDSLCFRCAYIVYLQQQLSILLAQIFEKGERAW